MCAKDQTVVVDTESFRAENWKLRWKKELGGIALDYLTICCYCRRSMELRCEKVGERIESEKKIWYWKQFFVVFDGTNYNAIWILILDSNLTVEMLFLWANQNSLNETTALIYIETIWKLIIDRYILGVYFTFTNKSRFHFFLRRNRRFIIFWTTAHIWKA